MIARRLLIAGGGSGGFVLPPSFFQVMASGGGGADKATPRGFYYNGTVYFGYVSNAGTVQVASYNLTTGLTSTPVTLLSGVEIHAAPSVLVRSSDHRIVVAYAAHDSPDAYIAISTNPEDASSFSATNVDSQLGSSDYTYMTLVELVGEGKLYLFYRDYIDPGRIAYSTSSDGGTTWATRTVLATASGSAQVLYFRVGSDWNTRIDILTTDNDRVVTPSALYHLYYLSGAWHKSDGTVISATLPMAPSDMTLVKSNAAGAIDPDGVSVDGSGNVGGTFAVKKSLTNEAWTCRYRSGAWQNDMVVDVGGFDSGNAYIGGPTIDPVTPDTLYVPVLTGTYFEIWRYTTVNDGATWTGAQLTVASSDDALLVGYVQNGVIGLRALWSRGPFTPDGLSFTLSIEGAR